MLPCTPTLAVALCAAFLVGPQGRGAKPAEPAPAQDEDVAQKYFEIADYDANGFITISEAKASLALDRRSFALYDEDGDGRISPAEFRARYEKLVKNGGAFSAPVGKSGERARGPVSPSDLALRFDEDGDDALSRAELRSFLAELHSRLDPEVVLAKFDRDGSRRLEKSEIGDLTAFLDPARRSHPAPRVASIEELFGKRIPREEGKGTNMLAPRILGPAGAFERLDLDGDGRITQDDLATLQRPVQLPVRIAAVLATLDTNVDGAIDRAEFDAGMGSR